MKFVDEAQVRSMASQIKAYKEECAKRNAVHVTVSLDVLNIWEEILTALMKEDE